MKVDCSRVTHPFATVLRMYCYTRKTVRLACLNHAASVHSEPGSNSPKRVPNLVIHELLYSSSNELILNFDWGSQSIAQSKFQRASQLGKGFQQELSISSRQRFSRNFPKKLSGKACRRNRYLASTIRHVSSFRRRAVLGGSNENSFTSSVNIFSEDFLETPEEM